MKLKRQKANNALHNIAAAPSTENLNILSFNLCFQSLFLVLRGVHEPDDFFDRLLSSMRFHRFVEERGPPFRVCDVFDEEYDGARAKAQPLVPAFIAEASSSATGSSGDLDYEAFVANFQAALGRLASKLTENVSHGPSPLCVLTLPSFL